VRIERAPWAEPFRLLWWPIGLILSGLWDEVLVALGLAYRPPTGRPVRFK
jgi:hypothetical protein